MHSALTLSEEECRSRCPGLVRETLELIAGKWTAPIFLALHGAAQPMRYADLQRAMAPITPKELARHLRRLNVAGLVDRTVYPTNPPSVEYALSSLGHTLYPSVESLAHWALQYGDRVAENQLAYAGTPDD